MNNIKHIFFVGAFRDNEVDKNHPFINTLDKIRKLNPELNTLRIEPIDTLDVNKFISDIPDSEL